MATMATVVLPALELHDPDFPPTPLADDLAGDPGAREGLRVRDHLAVARHEQHRPELDGGARLAGQFLDRDDLPRRHAVRSEEHTSELQSLTNLVCRLLLEKK